MNRFHSSVFGVVWLCVLLGCEKAPPPVAPPTPEIPVATPIEKDVVDYEDFTGRTDAVDHVDIRARVSGYLVKVNFKDGETVKKGHLLYEIDPRPFQADLDQANGALERLQAEKKLLVIQVERYTKLAVKGAGSQQDLDQYLAQQAENVGAIKSAEAQIERAKLNLDFTRITAPIDGKLSRTLLTEGNLVNADTTQLTTIVSINPMYAYFTIEEPTMLEIRRLVREGVIKSRSIDSIAVRMGMADDVKRTFPLTGSLDFINNTVDPQTGTILVRGIFQNPYTAEKPPVLVPGCFVRVRLEEGLPHKTLLVVERAIGTDQGNKYVYIVDAKNKIAYRQVTLGMVFDGLQAIESGLEPGDRVVVNRLQSVRPGMTVKPQLVKMTDEGK